MAKRRRFTPKFKAEVVLEALRGESSQLENAETFFASETDKVSSESADSSMLHCSWMSSRAGLEGGNSVHT